MKLSNIFKKKFYTKKRIIWGIIILVVLLAISYFAFGKPKSNNSIQSATVTRQDLLQTVLATGQVVSGTDLNLSFQGSGMVSWIGVKEGDEVKAGQTLATLNQASAKATLTSALGALAQAEANYEKLMAGATLQDIKVVENSVTSAKIDLESVYDDAVITLEDTYIKAYNALSVVITLQDSYFSTADQAGTRVFNTRGIISESVDNIKTRVDALKAGATNFEIESALANTKTNLSTISDSLRIIRTTCDEGIYYSKVSSTDKTSVDTQRGYITTALNTIATAQQTINADKIALQKAQDQLSLKKAPPTDAEISLAKAQILSAQGQVDAARATLGNMAITAPSDGTITNVGIKVGEQATATVKAIVLQNISSLHAEADVSEANIALLQTGQTIDYTFDALNPDRHFTGKILTIDPASTVVSGVVNYKIKGSMDEVPEIKPGMTANMTIQVAEKSGVLAVPSTAIVNRNKNYFVRVIDDEKKMTYHEVQVSKGLEADGGLVEITSGLSGGEKIITYIKK